MKESDIIKKLHQKLLDKSFVLFPQKGTINISNEQGVYILYSPDNLVLHVGTTKDAKKGLNQRLQNHLNNQSFFSKQFLKRNGKILRTGYKFKYIEVNDVRRRALLEALTLGMLCPAHIGTGEKK